MDKLDLILQKLDGIDELNQRIGGIEQRLDGMDQRFEGIEQRLDGMDQRFEGIEQRLENVERRMDTFDEVKEITYALRHGQEIIIANLDALTLDVRQLQGQNTRLEEQQVKLKSEHGAMIDILNRRQLVLEADMAQLKSR